MAEQPTTAEDLQARLIARAWEDDEFKQALLDDPKSAIADELGVELPGDLEIQVVEENPNMICLVLPVRPETARDPELSEEELEAVAGGGVVTVTRDANAVLFKTGRIGGFGRLVPFTDTMPRFRGR